MTSTMTRAIIACRAVAGLAVTLAAASPAVAQGAAEIPPPAPPPPVEPAATPMPAAAPVAVPAPPPPTAAPMAEPAGAAPAAVPSSGPKVGGHIGVAVPLVTVASDTTTVADAFDLVVPIGISVKFEKVVVDFETVVVNHVDNESASTGLVVDPGIVYNWGPVATGLRAMMEINQTRNFGLIPLINKGLVDLGAATWFVEAAFPTRVVNGDFSFTVVLHTGVGF